MSLEKLRSLVETLDNNEEFIATIDAVAQERTEVLDRLSFLEKDLNKSIDKRDNQASLIKKKLGLKEISEEAIDSFLESVKSTSDDAEVVKLRGMLEEETAKRAALEEEANAISTKYAIESQLNKIGFLSETRGGRAYDTVLGDFTKMATVTEDGSIVFKDNDGSTLRNNDGSPKTLADIAESYRSSEDNAYLFVEPKPKKGSGVEGGDASPSSKSSLGGSKEDQAAYFRQKFGLNS